VRAAETAKRIGIEPSDYVLPHQANGRMNSLLAGPLGLESERIIVTADRMGNTGSAAIWLALAQVRSALKSGETVLALGAEATDFMFGGFRYCHG
jgi:3-oxoacyl-[acyl-carrier-protein] synthase-3